MALVLSVQRLTSLLSSMLTSAQPQIGIKHHLAGEQPSISTADFSHPSSVWSPRGRCLYFPALQHFLPLPRLYLLPMMLFLP